MLADALYQQSLNILDVTYKQLYKFKCLIDAHD